MKPIEIKNKKGEFLYVGPDTRQGASRLPKWRVCGTKYLTINGRRCSGFVSDRIVKTDNPKSYHIVCISVLDEPTVIKIGREERSAETKALKFCKSGDWKTFLLDITNRDRYDPFILHLMRKLNQLPLKLVKDCDNCPDKFICWTRK